jgi:hypothetical protein
MKSIKQYDLGGCSASIIGGSQLRSTPFSWTITVGRSIQMPLAFTSIVIPGSNLHETHDQDFCSLLDMYVFRNWATSLTRERSAFLFRHYVCCAIVSARVYLSCHGLQVTGDSVHTCHCTILGNIFTRYTVVFCQCRLVQQFMP